MKFYYSILKISPNTASGDSVSIGLLAFDKNEAIISFSESRKLLAKKMMPADLVDFFCKQLTNKVKELNKLHQSNFTSLFEKDFVFDSAYIDYLSNYSNGALQLTKSNVFLKELNDTSFNFLFETLIDKVEIKHSPKKKATNIRRLIEEKLINRVKDKVHTDIKLDHNLIPNLFFSYDLDCIGKNGVLIGAKSVDFTATKNTLDNTISHYSNLIALLSINLNKDIVKNKFYLIAEEPINLESPEYGLWDTIQTNPLFKVIHPEQSELVAENIEKSKATKFFN